MNRGLRGRVRRGSLTMGQCCSVPITWEWKNFRWRLRVYTPTYLPSGGSICWSWCGWKIWQKTRSMNLPLLQPRSSCAGRRARPRARWPCHSSPRGKQKERMVARSESPLRRQEVSSKEEESAMQIPDSVRALIATGPYAHLTTLNPNGSPQVTVVWVGIDNEEFVLGHMGVWQKVKNVRRDPRVVLSLLGPGKNA